ncbi:MAG: hypothetical protein A3F11_04045 [Gammaproteobacteria bacterium RIFCSPHIGHO2_12_FULL_37_14]|nr:MAG: hypothetical protein A3F11_04045 [Gammaproteobacteria bacterium RIFCSPHIGHO2_12_FULL_37_14]
MAKREAVPLFGKKALSFIEVEPELNYIAGVTSGNVAMLPSVSFSPQANIAIPVGWNYLDGLCAIITGTNQLLDADDYHQSQNKFKGVLNILSGIQLFALSYTPGLVHVTGMAASATPLAGTSFAFAMLCDLINASIDFYHATKEIEFDGWLEEREKEVKYIRTRINTLRKKRATLQDNMSTTGNRILDDADNKNAEKVKKKINNLNDRIEKLVTQETTLLDEMQSRCRVHFHTDNTTQQTKNHILNIKNMASVTNLPTSLDRDNENRIQSILNQRYQQNRVALLFKSLSFIGMTCLAIAPFILPICPLASAILFATGLITTNAVSLYYIYNNVPRVKNNLISLKNSACHLFFKNREANLTSTSSFTPQYQPC